MFILWRGYGWLTPIIGFIAMIGVHLLISAVMGREFRGQSEIPMVLSILVASGLVGLFGLKVNRNRKRLIDPENGEEHITPSHSLFFIPIQYWAIIFPVFMFVGQSLSSSQKSHDVAAIQSPVIGDLYYVDVRKVLDEKDAKFKYSVMKLVEITPEQLSFNIGSMGYNSKKTLRAAIRDEKHIADGYYFDYPYEFSPADLIKLTENRGVYNIVQQQDLASE